MTPRSPRELASDVKRLKREGFGSRMIGNALGLTPAQVDRIASTLGARKRFVRFHLRIAVATAQAIRTESVRRGIPYHHLIRKILTTVARENLFSAVLDDDKR